MGSLPTCPGVDCDHTAPDFDALAHHMQQKKDDSHPWDSWVSAREEAVQHNENRTTAEGSDHEQPGKGVPNPPSDESTTVDGKIEAGGQEADPSMAAPEWSAGPSNPCPNCGKETHRLAKGQLETIKVDGKKAEGYTDEGDRECRQCDLIITNDGGTYERY